MKDSHELNRMLMDRMDELVVYLLPNGKRQGNKWVVGSMAGEAGESCQITVSGGAIGRFFDHAHPEDKGSNPLYLWSKVKGVTYVEAIKQASEWLGVRSGDFGVKRLRQKAWRRSQRAIFPAQNPNLLLAAFDGVAS